MRIAIVTLIIYIVILLSRKACVNIKLGANIEPFHPSHKLTDFFDTDFTILFIPDFANKLSNY